MQRKFTALRTIGTILKVLAIVVGAITILIALASCGTIFSIGAGLENYGSRSGGGLGGLGVLGGILGGLLGAIGPALAGGALTLFLYAMGESIYLGIDIEENTRTMVDLLRHGSRASGGLVFGTAVPAQAPVFAPPVEARLPPASLPAAPLPVAEAPALEPAAPLPAAETPVVEPEGRPWTAVMRQFCPQCGTRVSPEDASCPACHFVFEDQRENGNA